MKEISKKKIFDNKNEAIIEVSKKNNYYALYYTIDELKDDFDVVLNSVKNYGDSLCFASDRLKDNEQIVIEAIYNDLSSLRYASERLKNKYKGQTKWKQ